MTDATPALPPPPERPRFVALRSILAILLREMEAQYGRNPGGYIWAVVQPVALLIVMAIAFGLIMRAPALGTSFILFYASAYLPLEFFSGVEGKVRNAVQPNRPLLSYPRVTWMDAVMARLVLVMLTQAVVMTLIMAGIILTQDVQVSLSFGPILGGIATCAALGFGMGLVNMYLNARIEIWRLLWQIINRPLTIASGLFFIYESLPPAAQGILYWNPLFHATGTVRRGIYPTYDAAFAEPLFMAGSAMGLILLGLLFLRQGHRHVLDR